MLICNGKNKTTIDISLPNGGRKLIQSDSPLLIESVMNGFFGGKCETWYDVHWIHYYPANSPGSNQLAHPNACASGTHYPESGIGVTRLFGSISHIAYTLETNTSDGNRVSLDIFRMNGTKVNIYGGAGAVCIDSDKYSASILSVSRIDGLPDNCGNEGKCKLAIKKGNQLIYETPELEGQCPKYTFSCDDDCPGGRIKCKCDKPPGYCCLPCKDLRNRFINLAN